MFERCHRNILVGDYSLLIVDYVTEGVCFVRNGHESVLFYIDHVG